MIAWLDGCGLMDIVWAKTRTQKSEAMWEGKRCGDRSQKVRVDIVCFNEAIEQTRDLELKIWYCVYFVNLNTIAV